MNVNFVKSDVIPNKFDKTGSGTPLLALYYNLGKKDVEWSFGVSKALKFLIAVREQWEDYEKNKDTLWSYNVFLGGDKSFELNRVRIQVLKHFEKEIEEYLKLYNKPRKAIVNPTIETIEDSTTGDYLTTLLLPCYEKGEWDEGDGLLPLRLTQNDCKYLFDPEGKGITMKELKAYADTNPNTDYMKHVVSRDGKEFDITYGKDKIACLLKYRRVIQNFKDDPTEINDE